MDEAQACATSEGKARAATSVDKLHIEFAVPDEDAAPARDPRSAHQPGALDRTTGTDPGAILRGKE